MRREVVLTALLLPLCSCYTPPQDPGYGYAPPGYSSGAGYGTPPPGYPAGVYAPTPYDPSDGGVYPGYSDSNGAPTIIVGSAPVPLVLLGDDWGYYDSGRRWHRAPDEVSRHLRERESGGGFRRGEEGRPQFRPDGRPPGPGGFNQGTFRNPEQLSPGGRPPGPGGFNQGTFRNPEQLSPGGRPPGPGGFNQGTFRNPEQLSPGGRPPGPTGFNQGAFRANAPVGPAPAPPVAPRASPAPQPAREIPQRGRECPPGQRC